MVEGDRRETCLREVLGGDCCGRIGVLTSIVKDTDLDDVLEVIGSLLVVAGR